NKKICVRVGLKTLSNSEPRNISLIVMPAWIGARLRTIGSITNRSYRRVAGRARFIPAALRFLTQGIVRTGRPIVAYVCWNRANYSGADKGVCRTGRNGGSHRTTDRAS